MNRMIKAVFACAFACALTVGLASAQTDPNDDAARLKSDVARLKKEIQRATADIRHADSLTREENQAAAQNLERWQRDRERRGKEIQDLNARLQVTRSKVAAEQSRMHGYTNGVEEIKAQEKSLTKIFSAYADSLLALLQAGPPWDLDMRRDRILSLKRDLEAGSASPEEAFGRLTAIFKEEIKSGDEVALLNRPLTRQNGEAVNAQILKLGNQALLYMDDEEKKFGLMERRIENGRAVYAWREDLTTGEKNAIKLALTVKAGREAPQLVPLNMVLSLDAAAADAKGGR